MRNLRHFHYLYILETQSRNKLMLAQFYDEYTGGKVPLCSGRHNSSVSSLPFSPCRLKILSEGAQVLVLVRYI